MLTEEQIKHLRLFHSLTLQDVADVMGVSKNYISMIENRKVNLSEEQYNKLINAIYVAHSLKNSKVEIVEENIDAVKKEVVKRKKATKK